LSHCSSRQCSAAFLSESVARVQRCRRVDGSGETRGPDTVIPVTVRRRPRCSPGDRRRIGKVPGMRKISGPSTAYRGVTIGSVAPGGRRVCSAAEASSTHTKT
jgi:hypothetical protein